MFKKLKVVLSTFLLLSLATTVPLTANALEGIGSTGGINSSNGRTSSGNDRSWDMSLYINHSSGDGSSANPGTSATGTNSIVGAHVTIMACNRNILDEKLAQGMTKAEAVNDVLLNGSSNDTVNYTTGDRGFYYAYTGNRNYGGSASIGFRSFYLLDPGADQIVTYPYNYSPRGNTFNSTTGIDKWRWSTSNGQYDLIGVKVGSSGLNLNLSNTYFSGYNPENLYKGNDLFIANANYIKFYGATNRGELPENTKDTMRNITTAMIRGDFADLKASSNQVVLWLVEPVLSTDINLDKSGDSWHAYAMTPALFAKALEDNNDKNIVGFSAIFSPTSSTSFINFCGTDGYAGTNPNVQLSDWSKPTRYIDEQGSGAYAFLVGWEEEQHLDTLPEIPSVPVFTKSGNSISYYNKSATVSQEAWSEITEVLSYGMNLTDNIPANDLYNAPGLSGDLSSMRSKSKQATDENGNYNSDYLIYYNAVWDDIVYYYGDDLITFSASAGSNSTTTTTIPKRQSVNQPSSVVSLQGCGTDGPFDVEGNLGNVNNTMNLSYKTISLYKLGSSTDIVDTNATSISSLGSNVRTTSSNDFTVSFGEILANPYAYSLVIETPDITINSAFAPEPPNIVIYDEDSVMTGTDRYWNATIDDSDWNRIKNTWAYAYSEPDSNGSQGSNDLGIQSANDARTNYNSFTNMAFQAEFSKTIQGGADYLADIKRKYIAFTNYKSELENLIAYAGYAIDTINETLPGTLFNSNNDNIYIEHGALHDCYATGASNCITALNYNVYGNLLYGSYDSGSYSLSPGEYDNVLKYSIFTYGNDDYDVIDKGELCSLDTQGTFGSKWYDMYWDFMNNDSNGFIKTMNKCVYVVTPQDGYNYFDAVFDPLNGSIANVCSHHDAQIWASTNGTDSFNRNPLIYYYDHDRFANGEVLIGEYLGERFLRAQCNAYTKLKSEAESHKTWVDKQIDTLAKDIENFEKYYENYLNNLSNAEQDIINSFTSMYLVKAEQPTTGNIIANDITTSLFGRVNTFGTDGGARTNKHDDSYNAWDSKPFVFSGIDTTLEDDATAVSMESSNFYSSYEAGVNNYNIYPLDNSNGQTIYGVLDEVIQEKVHTEFKYRVVYTGDPDTHMSLKQLKDLAKGNACTAELSYEMVLKAPYSYGIIINGYTFDDQTVELTEWQLNKVSTRTIGDKVYWNHNNDVDRTTFNPDDGTFITIDGYNPTPGKVTWHTRKTPESSPESGNTTNLLGGDPATPGRTFTGDSISKETTGRYILTNSWEPGDSTATLLTSRLIETAYHDNDNGVALSDNDIIYYDYKTGSSFDVWRDQGTMNMITITPMYRSSFVNYNNGDVGNEGTPSSSEDNDLRDGYNNPKPVNPATGTINPVPTGWWLQWSKNPSIKLFTSQYEVKIDYSAITKLKTTFSTDDVDIDAMNSDNQSKNVPYIKAGQAISGEISNNVLTISGYCNVPYNYNYLSNTHDDGSVKFHSDEEFFNYMDGIVAELAKCPIITVSTIDEFNQSIKRFDSRGDSVNNIRSAIGVEYTKASGQSDTDAGLDFTVASLTHNTPSQSNGADVFSVKYTNQYFDYDAPGSDTNYAKSTSRWKNYGNRTQMLFNDLISAGEGTENWYYEYTEGMGYAYYYAEIDYGNLDFDAVVSKYASDANDRVGDVYLKEQTNKISTFKTLFGYDTNYRDVDGHNNVIATAIDTSDIQSDDLKDLLRSSSGSYFTGILGIQTPIHIRGNVYDNT